MKTLYLHIGTPKTGTTSIQNFCMDNQKQLEEKGFYFPIFDYHFRNIGKYCNAHFLLTRYWNKEGEREYEREEALALDGTGKVLQLFEKYDNIILSEYCEIISKEKKGTRKLAYEIKGNKTGYYYYVSFQSDSMDKNYIGKMSIKINTIEEIIKHIFIKMED